VTSGAVNVSGNGTYLHLQVNPGGTDPATAWRAVSGHGINDAIAYLGSVGWL